VIEFQAIRIDRNRESHTSEKVTPMLAEFFLVLETLKSHAPTDGSQIVVSTARFVPVTLPPRSK
jgi:hypothetical protein